MSRTSHPPQVLILGGGFAGRAAARALRGALRRGRCRVTLVDRNAYTTMIPALPDVAAGLMAPAYVTESIARLLPTGVAFLQAQIDAVELDARCVRTSAGTLDYDYLVLAMGSVAALPEMTASGAGGYGLATLDDAIRLRDAFNAYVREAASPHVLISGAGYTGIELAAALRRATRRAGKPCEITLLERGPEILRFLNSRQRRRVLRSLDRQQILLRTGCGVVYWAPQTITCSDGTSLHGAFACVTQGTRAPLLPNGQPLAPLPDGRLPVNATLSLTGRTAVYAAGDSAAFCAPGGMLRKAVNFAIYTGARAGANIARALAGRSARAFRPVDLGWVIPLGDDSVGRAFGSFPLAGRAGRMLHYVMCGLRNFNARNAAYFVRYAFTETRKEHA